MLSVLNCFGHESLHSNRTVTKTLCFNLIVCNFKPFLEIQGTDSCKENAEKQHKQKTINHFIINVHNYTIEKPERILKKQI